MALDKPGFYEVRDSNGVLLRMALHVPPAIDGPARVARWLKSQDPKFAGTLQLTRRDVDGKPTADVYDATIDVTKANPIVDVQPKAPPPDKPGEAVKAARGK